MKNGLVWLKYRQLIIKGIFRAREITFMEMIVKEKADNWEAQDQDLPFGSLCDCRCTSYSDGLTTPHFHYWSLPWIQHSSILPSSIHVSPIHKQESMIRSFAKYFERLGIRMRSSLDKIEGKATLIFTGRINKFETIDQLIICNATKDKIKPA